MLANAVSPPEFFAAHDGALDPTFDIAPPFPFYYPK
jgi:hypothetical protein